MLISFIFKPTARNLRATARSPEDSFVGLSVYFFPIILDVLYMYTFVPDLPELAKTALKVYPDISPEAVVTAFQSEKLSMVFGKE